MGQRRAEVGPREEQPGAHDGGRRGRHAPGEAPLDHDPSAGHGDAHEPRVQLVPEREPQEHPGEHLATPRRREHRSQAQAGSQSRLHPAQRQRPKPERRQHEHHGCGGAVPVRETESEDADERRSDGQGEKPEHRRSGLEREAQPMEHRQGKGVQRVAEPHDPLMVVVGQPQAVGQPGRVAERDGRIVDEVRRSRDDADDEGRCSGYKGGGHNTPGRPGRRCFGPLDGSRSRRSVGHGRDLHLGGRGVDVEVHGPLHDARCAARPPRRRGRGARRPRTGPRLRGTAPTKARRATPNSGRCRHRRR